MTKQLTQIEQVRNALTSPQMMAQFKAALPDHIAPEKFLRIVLTAVNKTPKLLECDRKSLFASCMLAAQDGLLPDGRESVLVIFGNAATYMPMVGGIMKKIRNSGELKSLSANIVYENDKFEYYVDENGEHFRHSPVFTGERGAMVAVYAQALTTSGGVYFDLMSKDDVKKVQSKARSKNIWSEWESEMWKKTAIRRLSKKLPMSTDLEITIRRDDDLYDLSEPKQEPSAPVAGQPTGLMDAMGIRPEEAILEAEVVPNQEVPI